MPLCDLSRETFVQYLSSLYEHSGKVVERAYNTGLTAGHDNPELLARALQQSLNEASELEKLTLIRAYPDLLGKAAKVGCLSRSASSEFASAGLDRCTPEQIENFTQLNSLYWARFGFPFVMAVQGSSMDCILAQLSKRVCNDKGVEFQNALIQIHRIARLRLDKLSLSGREERGLDTPLAHPVEMAPSVAGNAKKQAPSKAAPGTPDEDVQRLWSSMDKLSEPAGIFSRFVGGRASVLKRKLARLSAFFTPATLVACLLSFGFGWMLSQLLK